MNMLAASMIQVSPQIKLKPFQRAGQTYAPVQIHLTGMRILIEARDDTGHTLWKDFPTSHGLYSPCIYDPTTRQIDALPSMEWWSQPLQRLFAKRKLSDTHFQIHRRREANSWIILNTLDNIFGHSLLLLLNAQYYLDRFPQHGLIVIATPELLRYIPADVHEIWELKTTPRETERWHAPLNNLFQQRCTNSEVHLACAPSHPDPSRYDLRRFNIIPATGPANTTAPKIVFIYRGTRLWGGTWRSERARLIRLAKWLKKLWPESRLEIFGHAPLPAPIPGWLDQTRHDDHTAGTARLQPRGNINQPPNPPNYEDHLLQTLAAADLVLGAHGSSQLLPTAIARLVLQLTPLDKQPSLLQDFLFDAPASASPTSVPNLRQHLWRRRFLYGNSTLSDISPRQVAQLINAMISMQAQFDFYQSTAASDPLRDPAEIEKNFAEIISPQIESFQARLHQTLDRRPTTRLFNFLRRLIAEHD